MRIYVASSWRCELQPGVVDALRKEGHTVYDFRNPPNGSGFAWREVDPSGARDIPGYLRAIEHPRSREGYASDIDALNKADATVLVLPCGRSAHLELGYAVGRKQRTAILLAEDKFEPELMYLMVDRLCRSMTEVLEWAGR